MKLAPLPIQETSVKLSLTVKKSTSDLLDYYQSCYEEAYKQDVSQRDLIENMLIGYMRDDRDFQKLLAAQGNDLPAVRKQKRISKNAISADAQQDGDES